MQRTQESRSSPARFFDPLFAFLTTPGVRRVRRWSFLVTLPAGYALSRYLRYRPSPAIVAIVLVALASPCC